MGEKGHQNWTRRINSVDCISERIQRRSEKEKQAQKTDNKSKVKDAPVGKINRRKPKHSKSSKTDNRDKKERHCFRCSEPNWTPDHAKDCKARKAKCKRCEKVGHFEKYCKTKLSHKKDKKEKVRKIDSSDSENTDYSTSNSEKSESAESVNRFAEVVNPSKKRVAELLTVKQLATGKMQEPDNCTEPAKNSNSK